MTIVIIGIKSRPLAAILRDCVRNDFEAALRRSASLAADTFPLGHKENVRHNPLTDS
jgi:hypothetical protein